MPVYKDKNNKYYYVTDIYINGKRKQKKKRGFNTQKEAKQALTEVQDKINKGTYVEPSNMFLKDFLEEWFRSKRNEIGIQTQGIYQIYLNNYIIPNIGDLKLSSLETIKLQTFINDLSENGYSAGTIKKVYNILSNSLSHAHDLELIPKNYAQKVKIPRVNNKKEITIWNSKQISTFLNIAKSENMFLIFHLALTTGMRQGEILGLRWKDVNFEKGFLKVSQTLSHDGKTFIEGAKSKTSIRTIPLSRNTLELLKQHKSFLENIKNEYNGVFNPNNLVNFSQVGTAINPANVRRTFNRIIKNANLPKIRFHDLRHTHATLLLSEGINPKVISERLGHSNIKITLDIYSHVLPTMQEEAVNIIDKIIK
ncbi:integrase [Metabacillus crassostreae]|uniref:tyrosine-type recombinase/integrase n=1 Tax=Metabacillus crassostreae TaxID=929098 RepID=UPI001958D8A7|nr:tyrosine-type recombinase/integrase [Metabacillus crassostreae]MBM7604009.1 integrase [Metabacillus crassostreae]